MTWCLSNTVGSLAHGGCEYILAKTILIVEIHHIQYSWASNLWSIGWMCVREEEGISRLSNNFIVGSTPSLPGDTLSSLVKTLAEAKFFGWCKWPWNADFDAVLKAQVQKMLRSEPLSVLRLNAPFFHHLLVHFLTLNFSIHQYKNSFLSSFLPFVLCFLYSLLLNLWDVLN